METTVRKAHDREGLTDTIACGSVLATLLLGVMSVVVLLL